MTKAGPRRQGGFVCPGTFPMICVLAAGLSLIILIQLHICLKCTFIYAYFMIEKVFKKKRKKNPTTIRLRKGNPITDKGETFRFR